MTSLSKISPVTNFADGLSSADNFDIALTIAIIYAADAEISHIRKLNQDLLAVARREVSNRKYYNKRREIRHTTLNEDSAPSSILPMWDELRNSISDNLFRKKYRMTKNQFNLLCTRIKDKVGVEAFRTKNGVCGEIRVAIGLRMLCGGSYLDLIGRAYGIDSPQSIYNYFHTFIDWIEQSFDFLLVGLLRGVENDDTKAIEKLQEIAAEFAVDSSGNFDGCIGALDGLAIRIRMPYNVSDPANYFSRKNFFALNVQAICDRRKRILWIDPGHQGACHDSTAWQESRLYDLLESLHDKLKEHGFFIVGDSAYPLSAYLLVPYPNAKPNSSEDSFNFWLSNSRIQIECSFGEIIMRFGLFWRTLRFDLEVCCKIIRAAAKLHNFLVDCREDTADDDDYFRNLSYSSINSNTVLHDSSVDDVDDADFNFPLVTDNNAPRPTGRPTNKRKLREVEGRELRDNLCTSLFAEGMSRTKKNRMRYNRLGHVYFD